MSKKNNGLFGAAMLAGAAGYLYLQNTWIEKTDYRIPVKGLAAENEGLKIVQLADLHMPREQVNLDRLAEKVRDEKPDFIFLTGDQIEGDHPFDPFAAEKFFRALADIAPTYAITGNHDRHSPMYNISVDIYQKTGITFLDDKAVSVIAMGRKPIVIMGLTDKKAAVQKMTKDFLKKIKVRNDWAGQTRLLLAHRPENFLRYHADPEKSPDLTFAGHAHGGQVRIPKVGGLFAPGQGHLPKRTAGVYVLLSNPAKKIVISRGIGASSFPFRINNRPEMVVVTLTKDVSMK